MRLSKLAMALLFSVLVACGQQSEWVGEADKIHDIKAGMSIEQVVSILGEPTRKIDLMGVVVWEYEGNGNRLNVGFSEGKVNLTGLNGKEIVVPP